MLPEGTTTLIRQGGDSASAFVIEVLSGPDAGMRTRIDLDAPTKVLAGTSPVCALKLSDAACSRRHAAFETDGIGLRVEDLGSTNGTWLGPVKLLQAVLRGGEVLVLGKTHVSIRREDAQAGKLVPAAAFGRYIGASAVMRKLYPLCNRLALSDVPLVIEGETGTGKEVLAEAIHEASSRASKPFVVFDCTTVSAGLIEAALFGHERGAFTGATNSVPGVFEEANGGTLLIDEVGDLDLSLQAKLLRAIQSGEVRRIGSQGWKRVDVRVIAATRRDLDALVQDGRFRDDLFFRLAIARLELPPLRLRRDDIPLLVRYFWKRHGGDAADLPLEAIERFERHDWPGNIRELENSVVRLLALGELELSNGRRSSSPPTPPTRPGTLPGSFAQDVLGRNLPLAAARELVVDDFERMYVLHALQRAGGNPARAAELAGIADRHFRRIRARLRVPGE